MKRRRFLGGCLLPVLAMAGCTEQSGSETEPTTTAPPTTGSNTATETQTQTQTTGTDSLDSQDVPGWDGATLDTAALLDTHVRELSTAESYTATIQATGTQNGDVTFEFQLNASQQRVFGAVTTSGRPNREAYLTPEQSVIQIKRDEPTYNTNTGSSVEQQFEYVAAYQNDNFDIAFADSLHAFDYTYQDQTTFHGDTVFRFTATSTDPGTEAEAVLLVDARGIIRSAEFSTDDRTRTHEYTAIGETAISPPDWLDNVPQATTEEPTDGQEDTTIQDPDIVVDVEAAQWYWQFTYAERGIQSNNELIVPVDQPVALRATSLDVTHALTIPNFQTTVDARPDQTDIARFTPSETGEVPFQCTEYCGEGHSDHVGTVVVVNQDEYNAWKENQ